MKKNQKSVETNYRKYGINHECYADNLYYINGIIVDIIQVITIKDTKTERHKRTNFLLLLRVLEK